VPAMSAPVRGRAPSAAALLATLAVLAGCASAPPKPAPDAVSGRLVLNVQPTATTPMRNLNAGFELRGSAERGELRLTNPLGNLIGVAVWSPGLAKLTTIDGETSHLDIAALSREALGEPVPLQAMPDWLRGRPWPGAPSTPLPASIGTGFEQLGWRIDLANWGQRLVVASRPTTPVVTVRAVVNP
jgi:outer membrane lipoprotein LolB